MTTPRRPGWVVLLAVAGVVVGGAFAVRVTKHKPPAQPAPPVPAPKQAAPPDPPRSLARMAVGAGVAVVLALTIVVATRPSELDRTASPAATTVGPMPLAECQAGGWSPWCEFTIATTTPDDLGVDDSREYPVVLPGAKWREMLAVLGPVETYPDGDQSAHAPIADAVKTALPSARRVAVTMTGRHWKSVANDLAYRASEKDAPAYWNLADQLSAALGGPPMLTMGFPRP